MVYREHNLKARLNAYTAFAEPRSIDRIELISTEGAVATHRIFFSDGTYYDFQSLQGEALDNIITKDSYLEFPVVGKVGVVYVDATENSIYRWDNTKLKYYCTGRDYKEIEVINGGTLR